MLQCRGRVNGKGNVKPIKIIEKTVKYSPGGVDMITDQSALTTADFRRLKTVITCCVSTEPMTLDQSHSQMDY